MTRVILLLTLCACGGDKDADSGTATPTATGTTGTGTTGTGTTTGTTGTGTTTGTTGTGTTTGTTGTGTTTGTTGTGTTTGTTGTGTTTGTTGTGTTTGTRTTDTGSPTTSTPSIAYRSYTGTATAGLTSFDGEELWLVVTEDDSEVLCTITSRLTATAPRDDCTPAGATCDWAHDLVRSESRVDVDIDGTCLAVFGVDADSLDALDGTPEAYGYGLLAGHADVLLTDPDDGYGWRPIGFAFWDPTTDAFRWSTTVGVVEL
jgi:hypothetical protein